VKLERCGNFFASWTMESTFMESQFSSRPCARISRVPVLHRSVACVFASHLANVLQNSTDQLQKTTALSAQCGGITLDDVSTLHQDDRAVHAMS
jgi:hypothetical protein